jgi:hypothetical protein
MSSPPPSSSSSSSSSSSRSRRAKSRATAQISDAVRTERVPHPQQNRSAPISYKNKTYEEAAVFLYRCEQAARDAVRYHQEHGSHVGIIEYYEGLAGECEAKRFACGQ